MRAATLFGDQSQHAIPRGSMDEGIGERPDSVAEFALGFGAGIVKFFAHQDGQVAREEGAALRVLNVGFGVAGQEAGEEGWEGQVRQAGAGDGGKAAQELTAFDVVATQDVTLPNVAIFGGQEDAARNVIDIDKAISPFGIEHKAACDDGGQEVAFPGVASTDEQGGINDDGR